MSADRSGPNGSEGGAAAAGGAKRWLFRLLAIGLGLAAALLVAETAVRLYLSMRPNDIEALRQFERQKRTAAALQIADFVRLSSNHRLGFELIPRSEGEFRGARIRINDAGFFDRERSQAKPPRVYRIAALGDSILFGWGVPIELRGTSLLERFLNRTAAADWRYEVLNFAVPGYNTMIEAELLRSRVLAYQPDAVLLSFCYDNDYQLPSFIARPLPLRTLNHSYLLDLLDAGRRGSAREALRAGLLTTDPNRVPPEYRPLVGWPRTYEALEEIRALAAARGLPAFFVLDYYWLERWNGGKIAHNDDLARLYRKVEQLDYQIVDAAAELLDYLGRHQYHSIALWLHRRDVHPNPIKHAIVAKAIYRRLVESGDLPDGRMRRARLRQDLELWDQLIARTLQRRLGEGELQTQWEPPAPAPGVWRTEVGLDRNRQPEHLGMGWCEPEEEGAWICGDPAALHFRLDRRTPLVVRLKAQPASSRQHATQTVVARLNGREQQTAELPGQSQTELVFSFAEHAAQPGLNRLRLSAEWAAWSPRRDGHPQQLRSLQVSEVSFSQPVAPP
ncbi:MAG TPA: SGNH/GDSL hydrolase family protein [Acidobacteriota bacterium]